MMLGAAALSLCFYVKFCFQYAHVCSMNIRYIMCAVYIGCLVIAAAAAELQRRAALKSPALGNGCRKLMTAIPVVYAAAAVTLITGMEMVLP